MGNTRKVKVGYGISATFVGVLLMAARVFDAFNDPVMGVVVGKTKTRLGRFRPWLLIGTLLNAVVLYFMFAIPESMTGTTLLAYASLLYILWGVTYTLMDIPYWSMIPAITAPGKERETMSVIARSCAGLGYAIPTAVAMVAVGILGGGNEREGFRLLAMGIAVFFCIAILITVLTVKEKVESNLETPTIKEMFKTLLLNDQALAIVVTIVICNASLYLTQNLAIYRSESVVFSLQTFVVKLASAISVLIAGVGLDMIGLDEEIVVQSSGTLLGMRMLMTIVPMLGMALAIAVFRRKYTLTEEKLAEVTAALKERE